MLQEWGHCETLALSSVSESLPSWTQWVWFFAAIITVFGGASWLIFVFYPYILLTKKVMIRSLEISEQTARQFTILQEKIETVEHKLNDFYEKIDKKILPKTEEIIDEIKPIIKEVKPIVTDVQKTIHQLEPTLSKVSDAVKDMDIKKEINSIEQTLEKHIPELTAALKKLGDNLELRKNTPIQAVPIDQNNGVEKVEELLSQSTVRKP